MLSRRSMPEERRLREARDGAGCQASSMSHSHDRRYRFRSLAHVGHTDSFERSGARPCKNVKGLQEVARPLGRPPYDGPS